MAQRARGRRRQPLTAGEIPRRAPAALIVDDEPDVREMLRVALQPKGWTVTEASSGEEALDACEHAVPDVVVLDHLMPGMSGLECAAILRGRSADVRIIMFSAHLDPMATDEARRLGILPLKKTDLGRLHEILDLLATQVGHAASRATT